MTASEDASRLLWMSLMTARFTVDRPALSGLLPVQGAKHYIIARYLQVEGGAFVPVSAALWTEPTRSPYPPCEGQGDGE